MVQIKAQNLQLDRSRALDRASITSRGQATDSGRHHIISTRTMAWQAGHFARLNTNSSVTPAGVRGFVSFNSSSLIDVMIRR
ncbi:hypothetical protein [Bradyrhizobium sp. I1.7.5]|uniref:hypothetical protein n=1 Tax=Bradyrhizobium sp. I1.7.5 TaxID=3156363 RepID=UPI003395765A